MGVFWRTRGHILVSAICSMGLTTAICPVAWSPVAAGAEPVPCPLRMANVTAQSGITFRHTDGGSGRRYIVESVVAGLALFDYDGDGWIDIYFTNGAPLRGTVLDPPPRNALYRNNGDWTFTRRDGSGGSR